jgi:DNA phosphorothioation-dependent restriction protein DptH
MTGMDVLRDVIADHLAALLGGVEPGHCLRLDDLTDELAEVVAADVRVRADAAQVAVLRRVPTGEGEISPERAIELRNRKVTPLLLLVPTGEGHAASSLDNSFERRRLVDVLEKVAPKLREQLAASTLRPGVDLLNRHRGGQLEAWAHFLAGLVADPTLATFGRNLWQLGLVPDLGTEVLDRLEANITAVKALSRPSRASASIDDRMTTGGLADGPWRAELRQFLQRRSLANPAKWGRQLLDLEPPLTFDTWQLVETVSEDLEVLEVQPFLDEAGKLAKCGLTLGSDGELQLVVPDGGAGKITLAWTTRPAKVESVASWTLELLPPADLRNDEDEPLAELTVKGDKRRATVRVELDEDALSSGNRFVVRLKALGEFGEHIDLKDGRAAEAESQEFEVLFGDAPPTSTRRTAAASLPEAVLRAVLDGMDNLQEDQASWDKAGQVFGVRVGNRRALQIRVCPLLVELQRILVARPGEPLHFHVAGAYGRPADVADCAELELQLPAAVRKARSDMLKELARRPKRETAESAVYDEVLVGLISSYLASYRRALDTAEGEVLDGLLRLDALSMSVQHNNRLVEGVVLLPLHPLRLTWVARHDVLLRSWANDLLDVQPRGSRAGFVDPSLAARVLPANLPFATVDHRGQIAFYAQEITHGSGLYLVPQESAAETATDALCSVLQVPATSSSLVASSVLVAERLAAYQQSHAPSHALRLLAVHPGEGSLVSAALDTYEAKADAADEGRPERLEVLCYTDDLPYARPVPALQARQHELRTVERDLGANHLAPPMSLAVRQVDALLQERSRAHLAVMQAVGVVRGGTDDVAERAPSFHDLIVPLVTSRQDSANGITWTSSPALGGRGGRGEGELTTAHRAHQRGIGRTVGAPNRVPAVDVSLDGSRLAQLQSVHDRADWVVTVDRFVGVDLYDGTGPGQHRSYVLDYAPDFVEGVGDRLTVTTSRRAEVERLLQGAMQELGLAAVDQSVGSILTTLSVVSGRLALRLVGDTSRAREAVSLAAVVSHLRDLGSLDEQIVVPVDAHPEIFGPAARDQDSSARRCDLLLVRVGPRSFKIQCVEVKSRQEARLPQVLMQTIVDQVTDTRRLLESRFFAADPPRIDRDLQRARLASLLHYYAERSMQHGMIAAGRLPEIHRYIDRIEDSGEAAEISLAGYVISLEGAQGFAKKHAEVPITVLTAADLGRLGFTSLARHVDVPAPASAGLVVPEVATAPETPVVPKEASKSSTASGTPGLPAGPVPAETPLRGPSASNAVAVEKTPVVTAAPAEPAPEQLDSRAGELALVMGQTGGGTDVVWRVSTKGSPHAFIVGIPGQGKSVTTRRIVRGFADSGLPTLLFDFHGDMAADPPSGARVLDAAEGLPFSPFETEVGPGRPVNTAAWQIAEVLGSVAKLGTIQQNHVYRAIQVAYERHGWSGQTAGATLPTPQEFAECIQEVEAGAQGRNARERLAPFTDFGLFAEHVEDGFHLVSGNASVVVDLSKHALEEVQLFGAAFVLRKVYREMFQWGPASSMRLAVVLDEAHRMANNPTLPLLMKEGRKFGMSVLVASQSTEDFHEDVLRNVGAKIVFRTNYPASKKVAGFLRGRGGADLSSEIEKLDVGVAFVSTPDEAQARRTFMAE